MSSARTLPEYLKKRIQELPLTPGVYFFKNREGNPLYIGKAVSIRKRVTGHFRCYGETFSKEGAFLSQTTRIDFIETPSEAEALLLESSLVKQFVPKYNQELKDDKSYPYLKITAQEYPRLLIVRGRKPDGAKYFGPYTSAFLLKQAVKILRQEFPLRICRHLPKKVCLAYHLGQCGGPCEKLQSREDYLVTVKDLESFLVGRREVMVKSLLKRMRQCSKERDFETAKILYDQVKALKTVPQVANPGVNETQALEILACELGLTGPPGRIECFDISNIQGAEAVGSMSVFLSGRPARSEYRKFRIKTVKGIDDYRMMREVIHRRYLGSLAEKTARPDLIVIDGGKGHLAAVYSLLVETGLQDIPIISIAKQHEYLYLPKRSAPLVFPPNSPHLALIRRLRDEAHRFAITYHRKLHRKAAFVKDP